MSAGNDALSLRTLIPSLFSFFLRAFFFFSFFFVSEMRLLVLRFGGVDLSDFTVRASTNGDIMGQ